MSANRISVWTDLWLSVSALIRSWWRVDRIRISPTAGRLYRLDSRSILLVERRRVEIMGRTVGQTSAGGYVRYDCLSVYDGQPAELWVTPDPVAGTSTIKWITDGSERILDDWEVDVIGVVGTENANVE